MLIALRQLFAPFTCQKSRLVHASMCLRRALDCLCLRASELYTCPKHARARLLILEMTRCTCLTYIPYTRPSQIEIRSGSVAHNENCLEEGGYSQDSGVQCNMSRVAWAGGGRERKDLETGLNASKPSLTREAGGCASSLSSAPGPELSTGSQTTASPVPLALQISRGQCTTSSPRARGGRGRGRTKMGKGGRGRGGVGRGKRGKPKGVDRGAQRS